MEQKKLEKLENIKSYLESDNIGALNRYIEKIKPNVKNDEDFQDIFEELKIKDYDQALLLTEEVIFDLRNIDDDDDNEDSYSRDDYDDKDDMYYGSDDFNDLGVDQMDDMGFYDDKDDFDF